MIFFLKKEIDIKYKNKMRSLLLNLGKNDNDDYQSKMYQI